MVAIGLTLIAGLIMTVVVSFNALTAMGAGDAGATAVGATIILAGLTSVLATEEHGIAALVPIWSVPVGAAAFACGMEIDARTVVLYSLLVAGATLVIGLELRVTGIAKRFAATAGLAWILWETAAMRTPAEDVVAAGFLALSCFAALREPGRDERTRKDLRDGTDAGTEAA